MKILKTAFKTLLLIASLAYLIFALIKVSRPAGEMVCTGVDFQYTDSSQACLINDSIINNYLGRLKISPKGKTMGDIDAPDISKRLSAMPFIDTVAVYHTASGKLCMRITPYHPLLHVYAQDGDEFYVDDKGVIAPGGGLSIDLPVVTGHVTRKFASTRLLVLGQYLREDEYWNHMVEQINIGPKGQVEIIPRYAEQRILLGEPKDIADKLQRVRLFYEKAMPKTGWNKYHTINAIYKGQIICTK